MNMKVMTIRDLFNEEVLKNTPELMESVLRFQNTKVGKLHNEIEIKEWEKTRMSHSPFLYDLVQKRMEIEKEIDRMSIEFLKEHPEIESPSNYYELLRYVKLAHDQLREDLKIDSKQYLISFCPEDQELDPMLFNCIEKYINYRMVEISYVFGFSGVATYEDINKLFNSEKSLFKALDSISIDRPTKVREMLDADEKGAMEAADALLSEVVEKMGGSNNPSEDVFDRLRDLFGDVDIDRGDITSVGDSHVEQDLTVNGEVVGKILSVERNSDFGEKLEKLIREHSEEDLHDVKIN